MDARVEDKTCPICGLEHDGADYQRVRTVCSDALLLNAAKLLADYAELSEYAHDAEHLAAQARLRADSAEAELRKLRDQVRAANDEIDRLKALLAPSAASEIYAAQVAQDGVEL